MTRLVAGVLLIGVTVVYAEPPSIKIYSKGKQIYIGKDFPQDVCALTPAATYICVVGSWLFNSDVGYSVSNTFLADSCSDDTAILTSRSFLRVGPPTDGKNTDRKSITLFPEANFNGGGIPTERRDPIDTSRAEPIGSVVVQETSSWKIYTGPGYSQFVCICPAENRLHPNIDPFFYYGSALDACDCDTE